MKKWRWYILFAGCFLILTACSVQKDSEEKLREIDFTVVDSRDVPKEFSDRIEEEKEAPFWMSYGDNGYLYIARGYGEKPTSGYSVEVRSLYETTNTLVMKTGLKGPEKEEKIIEKNTYPYVVVKMEYSEKNVVFN